MLYCLLLFCFLCRCVSGGLLYKLCFNRGEFNAFGNKLCDCFCNLLLTFIDCCKVFDDRLGNVIAEFFRNIFLKLFKCIGFCVLDIDRRLCIETGYFDSLLYCESVFLDGYGIISCIEGCCGSDFMDVVEPRSIRSMWSKRMASVPHGHGSKSS